MKLRLALLSTVMMAGPALAGGPSYVPDMLPPGNPGAGECYARVAVPAQYETATETVVTREAHTKMHVEQAQLRARQEQVMIKEPSVRYAVRQPTYRTITEQVLTRPAYEKLSVTPPTFQTVTETIQTSAPRLVWKKGNPGALARQGYVIHSTADGGRNGQGYASSQAYTAANNYGVGESCGAMCEIWCLVEEPGQSVTHSRQVLSSPGQVRRVPVPARYQTLSKQVVADPGGVEEVPVPAEYTTVTVEDLVQPTREGLVEVPAEYGQVQTKRLVAEERYEWRRVLCAPGTAPSAYQGSTSGYATGQAYTTPSYAAPAPSIAPAYNAPSSTYSGGSYQSGSYISGGATGYYGVDDQDESTAVYSGQTYPDQGSSGRTYSGMGYGDSSTTFSSGSTMNVPDTTTYGYETGRHMRQRAR